MLLARRLIESGVRLVHVNWSRDPGDNAVDNPMWDTHALNADRLQDSLCPQFDVSFAALMDDLTDRGLLGETLVVVIGEFGRTPRINKVGGAITGDTSIQWRWPGEASAAEWCMALPTRLPRIRAKIACNRKT